MYFQSKYKEKGSELASEQLTQVGSTKQIAYQHLDAWNTEYNYISS